MANCTRYSSVSQQRRHCSFSKELELVSFSSDHARKPRRERINEQKNTSKHLLKTIVAEKSPDGYTRPMTENVKMRTAHLRMSEVTALHSVSITSSNSILNFKKLNFIKYV